MSSKLEAPVTAGRRYRDVSEIVRSAFWGLVLGTSRVADDEAVPSKFVALPKSVESTDFFSTLGSVINEWTEPSNDR